MPFVFRNGGRAEHVPRENVQEAAEIRNSSSGESREGGLFWSCRLLFVVTLGLSPLVSAILQKEKWASQCNGYRRATLPMCRDLFTRTVRMGQKLLLRRSTAPLK